MIPSKNELLNILEQYEKSVTPLKLYEEIWFFGDATASFALRAGSLAQSLKNFSGIVVSSLKKEKRQRISNQIGDGYWQFASLDSIVERSKKKKLILVDFNDTPAGFMFADIFFCSAGIDVCDYLRVMSDVGFPHTYISVDLERQFVIDNLDPLLFFITRLEDDLSRRTVLARIVSFLTLSRKPLIDVAQADIRFTKMKAHLSALRVPEDAVYVDAGAAHGDTLSEFFNAADGRYKAAHAFEPDSVNYKSLKTLSDVLPNCYCHNIGLSDSNSIMEFQESTENRFGSRFAPTLDPSCEKRYVRTERLDEILDYADLIKIDVEGYEVPVIKGSECIIKKYGPSMHISAYHYPQDLINIFETVMKIRSYRNVAVRHISATLYDTNILFSDSQVFH